MTMETMIERQYFTNLDSLFAAMRPLARLRAESDSFRAAYNAGQPYPHLVVDGLFDPAVLYRVVAEFPKREERDWIVWNTDHEDKTTSRGIAGLSTFTQLFFFLLNSTEFIDELKRITGIDDLVPDPLFFGAGLQESFRDGRLDVHADYSQHPVLPLTRRLNLLIYLNSNWNSTWGGDLELWNPVSQKYGANYAPLFNRTVLFPTTSETLHGVPRRLTCPEDRSRKLISVYYWSADESAAETASPLRWLEDQSWREKCEAAVSAILKVIPKNEKLILVDEANLAEGQLFRNYTVIPFLERDGQYWGTPPDDNTAISELERIRSSGARFIVFAWPAFWWLETYVGFEKYLSHNFAKTLVTDEVVIFDLRRN